MCISQSVVCYLLVERTVVCFFYTDDVDILDNASKSDSRQWQQYLEVRGEISNAAITIRGR